MICSIILAGGAGTRLWPISNSKTPKQFLKLFSENSMIVETSKRIEPAVPVHQQYVITGERYKNLTDKQFGGKIRILAEPLAKNTAPCILWAALKIMKDYGEDAVIVVLSSDHVVKDDHNFLIAVEAAVEEAKKGSIVTFGILPSRPETGYGYIEIAGTGYELNRTSQKIIAFKEKPTLEKAEEYIAAGNFFWNSGMFVFSARTIIQEFKRCCPDVYTCFEGIDPDNIANIEQAFSKTPSISIDYAVMEHTDLGCCIPSEFGWSDVGSFQSLHEVHEKDQNGNVCFGDVNTKNTNNCFISGNKRIVCIGIENLIVVEGSDSILVAPMNATKDIGDIAKKLNNNT
jgi:Mannose-1-phosphate guanylyltransferase